MEQTTKSIEGIFDVETKTGGYAFEQTKVAEGKVGVIQGKEFNYHSTAYLTNARKQLSGICFDIETSRGKETVEFPKEISLTDRLSILKHNIRYTQKVWRSAMEGTSTDYTLEILSGPLQGQKLEQKVFV